MIEFLELFEKLIARCFLGLAQRSHFDMHATLGIDLDYTTDDCGIRRVTDHCTLPGSFTIVHASGLVVSD